MMLSCWARLTAAWLLWIALGSVPAIAHDLPLDRFMNGFVKIGPHQADLVIRVPLDLLRAIPFPMAHGNYDLAASAPSIKAALEGLSSDISLWEGSTRLLPSHAAGQLVALSDRSFEDYRRAVAGIASTPTPDLQIGYELGYLDAHFVYPIYSPNSVFAIDSRVGADLGDTVKLAIRYLPLDGSSRVLMIAGGSGRVYLDPAWWEASLGFIRLGIEHILSGIDHMLFLLCLVIPFRRIKPLIPVITAFTLGHSITLIGTAYNLAPLGAWFPPFVEAAIAATIFYMAIENIVGASLRRRWIIAALFGLVHGFGFADILREQLQFAGSYLLVSLVSFNIGIEIGQLVVLCVFVPALALLFRGAMAGRMGIIVLSAIVANVAWQWMMERGEVFWNTPWPQATAAGLMELARWVLALGAAVAAANVLSKWLDRRHPSLIEPSTAVPQD
jgi:HupE / UreJ protein